MKMEALTTVAVWAFGAFTAGIARPPSGDSGAIRSINHDLAPKLSTGANILWPGSDAFDSATLRWSSYKEPTVSVVVEVADENDVAQTVKWANSKRIPFLARSGGHGAITTLDQMKYGIEIWLHKLNSVEISPKGNTAKIGGGTLSKNITDTLWAAGKQTVTGGCECTSLAGPALGGGHGFLQGQHGLIGDQFVSLRMVDANGNLRTITKEQDKDLWWAMNGAGHNFGIVTSFTSKIYDVKDGGKWSYASFVYTHDKVEALYEEINKLSPNGSQPVDVLHYSFFARNPAVDPEHALINFFILRDGVESVESSYTDPFNAIGPAVTDAGSGLYTDLPRWTGNANDQPFCQKGFVNLRYPVDIQEYNPQAQRTVFDDFDKTTREIPQFNNSVILFEGYSLQGVKAVPATSTAFPHREGNVLVSPLLVYQANSSLDQNATEFGERFRDTLFRMSGQKNMYSYVNYASGTEKRRAWYGYELWRIWKLAYLKAKHDPRGRFNFYAPIF